MQHHLTLNWMCLRIKLPYDQHEVDCNSAHAASQWAVMCGITVRDQHRSPPWCYQLLFFTSRTKVLVTMKVSELHNHCRLKSAEDSIIFLEGGLITNALQHFKSSISDVSVKIMTFLSPLADGGGGRVGLHRCSTIPGWITSIFFSFCFVVVVIVVVVLFFSFH